MCLRAPSGIEISLILLLERKRVFVYQLTFLSKKYFRLLLSCKYMFKLALKTLHLVKTKSSEP